MTESMTGSTDAARIAKATDTGFDARGDCADQASRLTMIMQAEAVHNALNGGGGEGSDDGLPYPLEDLEMLLAMEDADDASDDAMHCGGLEPRPWVSAEQAAIHIVDDPWEDDLEGRRSFEDAS